ARQRLRDISGARILLDNPPEPAQAARRPWGWATAGALALALAALSSIHFRETPPQPAAIRFQVPPPEGGTFSLPFMALSPDGRKLAFTATGKGGGQPLLWVRALDSLEARALPGTEAALFPFWSPD